MFNMYDTKMGVNQGVMPYLIDINWFRYIHCRKPYYQCINFIEFYILNNDNEPVDIICLYPSETKGGRFYEVDKERYDKIKKYMNDKGGQINDNRI